jgi:hypothetical protein
MLTAHPYVTMALVVSASLPTPLRLLHRGRCLRQPAVLARPRVHAYRR